MKSPASALSPGRAFSVASIASIAFAAFCFASFTFFAGEPALGVRAEAGSSFYLRIRDWKTGEEYVSLPAKDGSTLFFGWIHSLEKIPWNEYYHIDEADGKPVLVLDAVTFPAFGAGIPENRGRVCYVDSSGLIHMEQIDQRFDELVWLNSHTATRDIILDGQLAARGGSLPQHTRLRLTVERIEK